MNYLIGGLWLLCLFLFFFILGTAFSKADRCGPRKILTGYLIYSFGVAVFGITVQILNLEWNLFRTILIVWMILLLVTSIICIWRHREKHKNAWTIKSFLSNYWILFFIIAGVLLLSVLNYPAFWLGNRSDDGFYLTRIASYPYTEKPFEHDLATGLYTGHLINSYSLNTHELEASVFFNLLNIPIGMFARIFLSAANYIVFGCSIYSLAYSIFRFINGKKRYQSIIQIIPGIIFLFSANWVYLANNGIMYLQDSWQTSTAMYFGSSIVRTSGFFLLLIPFIDSFDLNWNVVAKVITISIVLISKSTIALPLIAVSAIAYIFVWLFYKTKTRKTTLLLLAGLIWIVGMCLLSKVSFDNLGFDSSEVIEGTAISWFKNILKSYIPWLTVVAVCSSVILKNTKLFRLLFLEFCIFVLLFVPGFQAYANLLSFFSFVIGRTITAFAYFVICTMISTIVSLMISIKIRKSILTIMGIVFTATMVGINYDSFIKYGGNAEILPGQEGTPITLEQALTVIHKNPNFMPVSTENLATTLNNLEKEKGRLAVLTETYYTSDGVADLKHVLTKSLVPTVIFPVANTRFVSTEDPIYGSYDVEQQAVFERFLINNDQSSTDAFGQLLNDYQIDAVLLRDDTTYDANMNLLGFSLYEIINGDDGQPEYYLYAR